MQRWFKKFRNGDESQKGNGRRHTSDVDNDELKQLIEEDPRTTIRELAVKLDVNHPTVLDNLKQLGKSKNLDKWMPHKLNENLKNRRYEVCSALLLRNNNNPFLYHTVTYDKKWILYDNRRRSAYATVVGPRRSFTTLSKAETIPKEDYGNGLVVVSRFDYYDFRNPGQINMAEKYCQEIDETHRKRHACTRH